MLNAELIDKLKELDEVTLLELLEVTSSDIVDAFYDKIYERLQYIQKELEE